MLPKVKFWPLGNVHILDEKYVALGKKRIRAYVWEDQVTRKKNEWNGIIVLIL